MQPTGSTQTITSIYPGLNRFDSNNGNIPFAGGPGSLFLGRTYERHPEIRHEIAVVNQGGYLPKLIPNSKLFVLGAEGLRTIYGSQCNLNKQRGFRFQFQSHECIATYSPIECWEYKDDEKVKVEVNEKEVGATRRKNYLFWAQMDFEKLLKPKRKPLAVKKFIRPPIQLICDAIDNLPKDYELILDTETRRSDHCLDCIGLGILSRSSYKVTVFVAPIYNYDDKLSYSRRDIGKLWRSLFKCFLLRKDITAVGHNLAFDLSVLFHYYHIPFPKKIFDTMLFMARQWPGVDKSLSHAISLYADLETNHKGDICPNISYSQHNQLLEYNAMDIISTAEVYVGQKEIYNRDPVLARVVDDTNRTQYITLLMSFTGCAVDESELNIAKQKLEAKINALTRIIQRLVNDPLFNPNSAQQGGRYFYGTLGYEVTETTATGQAKFDADEMYALQLKQNNPLFALIIAAKESDKQLSSLNFIGYESVKSNI